MKQLTINLIPKTSWYKNLRSMFSKEEWDVLRRGYYKKANYVCEICGDSGLNQGFTHPIECHEKWDFSEEGVQKLIRLISLCPMCHKCQHPGLAQINGEFEECVKHYMKVNKVSKEESLEDFKNAFKEWREMNKIKWEINIDIISKLDRD